MITDKDTAAASRFCGIGFIVTGLLSLLAMSHHPHSSAIRPAGTLQEIAGYSDLSMSVHSTMIVVILMYTILFLLYGNSRGLGRPLVAAGLCLFFTGSFMLTGAAILSGFISPSLALAYLDRPDAQLGHFEAVLTLSTLGNQALARLGSLAWLSSCLCWSVELFAPRKAQAALSLAGIAVTVATGAALASGILHLSVTGMTIIAAAIALWSSGLGLLLIARSR